MNSWLRRLWLSCRGPLICAAKQMTSDINPGETGQYKFTTLETIAAFCVEIWGFSVR